MKTVFSIFLLVPLLFISCNKNDDAPNIPSIEGVWTGSLVNPTSGDVTVPSVTLTIKSDKTYEIDFNSDGSIQIYGTYTYTNGQWSITDTGGDFSCDTSLTGVYSVSVTENKLTFSLKTDDCEARRQISGVWSK